MNNVCKDVESYSNDAGHVALIDCRLWYTVAVYPRRRHTGISRYRCSKRRFFNYGKANSWFVGCVQALRDFESETQCEN